MSVRRRWVLAAGATTLLAGASRVVAQPLRLVLPEGGARFERAYFGIHVHNLDAQRNWPDIPVGSFRLWDARVTWNNLERVQGRFDFERLDEFIAWAETRKLEVLLPFGVTPRWASARPDEAGAYGLGSAAEPADLDAWRRYVRAVVTRYKGRIAAYQVLNEANLTMFFSGSLTALAALVTAAAQETRMVDPAAKIVSPSGAGLDDRVSWPAALMRAGAGGSVDVVAFHLYHNGRPPETVVDPVLRLTASLAAAGYAKLPLWNTESGYWVPNAAVSWSAYEERNMSTLEDFTSYLPRDLLLARALGFERFHWYSWDHPKMGLIDTVTRAHRAPGKVYGQTIRFLTGATLESCGRDEGGLWRADLRNAAGGRMQALWLDPSAAPASMQVPAPWSGNARTWVPLDGTSDWAPAPPNLTVGPRVQLVGEKA